MQMNFKPAKKVTLLPMAGTLSAEFSNYAQLHAFVEKDGEKGATVGLTLKAAQGRNISKDCWVFNATTCDEAIEFFTELKAILK